MKKVIKYSLLIFLAILCMFNMLNGVYANIVDDKIEKLSNLLNQPYKNISINNKEKENIVRLDYSKALAVRNEVLKSIEEEKKAKEEKAKEDKKKKEKEIAKAKEKSTEKVVKNKKSTEKNTKIETSKEQPKVDKDNKDEVEIAKNTNSIQKNNENNKFGLSNEDYWLFICIVDVEASGAIYEEKLAVANVIYNRLKSGRYGADLPSIIYAKGQFPPAHNGVLADRLAKGPWSNESKLAVDDALSGNNNIGTAESFNMYYGQTAPGKTVIIGTTFFYNFK